MGFKNLGQMYEEAIKSDQTRLKLREKYLSLMSSVARYMMSRVGEDAEELPRPSVKLQSW